MRVKEPDRGVTHFARWGSFDPATRNAISRSAVPAPAREDDGAGREGSHRHDRLPTIGPGNNAVRSGPALRKLSDWNGNQSPAVLAILSSPALKVSLITFFAS